MTVSTNPIQELTVDELVELAWWKTGMITAGKYPRPQEYELGHRFMLLTLASLQRDGHTQRDIEATTLTLVAGTKEYDLPTDVIDVSVGTNDVAGTIVSSTASDAETIVTTMTRQEWISLSTKNLANTSRPAKVLIEKKGRVHLTFWPVPDSSVASFRYFKVNYFRNIDNGGQTVNIVRTWMDYIVMDVAYQIALASSLPMDRVQFLMGAAEAQKAKCLANDQEHGNAVMRPALIGRRW